MAKYHGEAFERTLAIGKALGNAGRVRVLMALRGGEMCPCQLTELLGLAGSTVSKHLSVLRQARLVAVRRHGRWFYFRRTDSAAAPAVRSLLRWLDAALARTPEVLQDERRAADIKRLDPAALCRLQRVRRPPHRA